MLVPLFSSLLLFLFGFFNLLGIKQNNAFSQLIFFTVALALFFLVRKIGYQFFRANARIFYWFLVVILIVTFIIGFEAKGSKRWVDFYFFKFQASEFLKIFFILFLADILSKKQYEFGFILFAKSFFYFIIPAFIIFKQPDFGNAAVYFFIFIVMIFFSRIEKKYVTSLFLGGALFIPISWVFLREYQRQRIMSFFSPHADQAGTSYNMIQALITVGSGKFFGRGLGMGTQSKLHFLPESHTDFAFSSLVEQFGFFGGFFVILLFIVLAVFLIRRLGYLSGRKTADSEFAFLYTLGFFSYLVFQIFVNIGMNLGLLPIAGIALPIISYGGSSLVAFMIGLALLP